MHRRAALVDEEVSPEGALWMFNPDAEFPEGTYVLTRYITSSGTPGGTRRMTLRFEGGCVQAIVEKNGTLESRAEWFTWSRTFTLAGGSAVSQQVCPPAARETQVSFALKRFQNEEFLLIDQGRNHLEFTKVD